MVVLYVVTVSYVAYCCLILGWLIATERSWIEALVKFGGIYGTLLAGIPVIIAVLVAKQQLDANRRQHVATVKRSLRKELEAIDKIEGMLIQIIESPLEAENLFGHHENHVNKIKIDRDDVDLIAEYIPDKLFDLILTLISDVSGFNERTLDHGYKRKKAEENLAELKEYAKAILDGLKMHRNDLSKYWS